jgi:hypothetical protein
MSTRWSVHVDESEERHMADQIVYGLAGGDLVFVPRAEAERLKELQEALNSAATWGDVRRQLRPDLFEELLGQCRDELESDPDDDDSFDPDAVPGYADGDWPEWPKQAMLEWMPARVWRQFGRVEASVLNGDFLQIDAGRLEALVAALEDQGFACRRDDALVARASGY